MPTKKPMKKPAKTQMKAPAKTSMKTPAPAPAPTPAPAPAPAQTRSPRDELRQLALELLKAHSGNPARATPRFTDKVRPRADLFDVLAFDYLNWVASGQRPELQAAPVAVNVKGANVKPVHKPARQRTESEKAAAFHAAEISANAMRSAFDERKVDHRPVGDLSWGELGALLQHSKISAASNLRLGTLATDDVRLLSKILEYAVVRDHSTKVRDVVPEKVLRRFIEESQREAPRLVEIGIRRYAEMIEKHKIEDKQITEQP